MSLVGGVREEGFMRFCKCVMLDVPGIDGVYIVTVYKFLLVCERENVVVISVPDAAMVMQRTASVRHC